MTVKCKFCGQDLALNTDSDEARRNQSDPRFQMREHLLQNHLADMLRQHEAYWLTDILFFTCPSDPEKWRADVIAMVDHVMRVVAAETRLAGAKG